MPYAVAFGCLPVFAVLADPGASMPPAWVPVAGALLGVGAHLVNVLPDLVDDEAATGVRGLPHRLGPGGRRCWRWPCCAPHRRDPARRRTMSGVLVLLTVTMVGALAVVALVGRGRTPFRAAIGIAVVDVIMLVAAG